MTRLRRTLLFPLFLAPFLAACATSSDANWFEAECKNKGLSPGSEAFASCVKETKAWVEWTQWRNEHVGRGP